MREKKCNTIVSFEKKYKDKIFTIHIQDSKVSLNKFDLVICPEHDEIKGDNVIQTKGSIHYLTKKELEREKNYIKIDRENKKIVAYILGGPNKYYNYSEEQTNIIFNKVKNVFTRDKYKLIIIPSYIKLITLKINNNEENNYTRW